MKIFDLLPVFSLPGAVKITPAHDPNDYEVGHRHKLPFLTMLTDDGLTSDICEEFKVRTSHGGLDSFNSRTYWSLYWVFCLEVDVPSWVYIYQADKMHDMQ